MHGPINLRLTFKTCISALTLHTFNNNSHYYTCLSEVSNKAETCSRTSTCLYIFVPNYSTIVGLNVVTCLIAQNKKFLNFILGLWFRVLLLCFTEYTPFLFSLAYHVFVCLWCLTGSSICLRKCLQNSYSFGIGTCECTSSSICHTQKSRRVIASKLFPFSHLNSANGILRPKHSHTNGDFCKLLEDTAAGRYIIHLRFI